MNDAQKIQMIRECFEEFYNDVDDNGIPLDNITRYDVFDSVEDIIFSDDIREADWEADQLDNMIRDTLPDDELI